MLTDDELAAKLAEAFGEHAGQRTPAAIDAAGIFRRGRRRRRRQIAIRAVSVTAAAGLVAGVLIAGSGAPAPAPAARPGSAQLPGNVLLDAAVARALPAKVAEAGMPTYYVVPSLADGRVQVRSSATGTFLSTVPVPAGCDLKSVKIAAAGNDRAFVLSCSTKETTPFYRLRITAGGHAAALTPLPVPPPPASEYVTDIALTPDGRKLAIGLQHFGEGPGAIEIAVVTLATGAVRTWTTEGQGTLMSLSWADHGRRLGFWFSGNTRATTGLRVLDISAAGGNLTSARQILSSYAGSDTVQGAMLSPDGTTIIASVTYNGPNGLVVNASRSAVVGGIVEISARTGQPLRTLLAEHAAYSRDGGGDEAGWYVTSCLLGAIDTTGSHLLVNCDRFGRLDRGRFTALPGVPPQTLYTAAW